MYAWQIFNTDSVCGLPLGIWVCMRTVAVIACTSRMPKVPTARAPLTIRAPKRQSSISPPPTSMLDVIGWLGMIAAKTTLLASSRSEMMLAFRALTYAKTQLW